jgi:D-alanyl-lipoteichoic acid acyltransferase DltB (MBOAT superfamily)
MISMLSPAFLGLVVVAVILLGTLEGVPRQLAFIAINLVFLLGMLLGVGGTLVVFGFLAIGYLLLLGILRDSRWAFAAGLPALVLLFVYMQDYKFLHLFVPESMLTSVLATVGLSFLFFKIAHVLIEAKSGTLGEIDGLSYVGYCTNFTAFAMGPLQRFPDFRDQWSARNQDLPLEHYLDAVIRILVGLVKAYVLAEWAKPFILLYGTDTADLPLGDLLLGIYAFNVYLYLNFAGYTDVMIGAGTLFGVRPPENFDKPFLARNVSDFWQRQHRSLTLWLTDYVYTPTFKRFLSAPRLKTWPLLANSLALMVTMVVSGLWHGTSFGFLLFGMMHGAYLVINRIWDAWLKNRFGKKRVRQLRSQLWAHALAIFITFNAVSFSFVPFQLGGGETVEIFRRLLDVFLRVIHV